MDKIGKIYEYSGVLLKILSISEEGDMEVLYLQDDFIDTYNSIFFSRFIEIKDENIIKKYADGTGRTGNTLKRQVTELLDIALKNYRPLTYDLNRDGLTIFSDDKKLSIVIYDIPLDTKSYIHLSCYRKVMNEYILNTIEKNLCS